MCVESQSSLSSMEPVSERVTKTSTVKLTSVYKIQFKKYSKKMAGKEIMKKNNNKGCS